MCLSWMADRPCWAGAHPEEEIYFMHAMGGIARGTFVNIYSKVQNIFRARAADTVARMSLCVLIKLDFPV
jgi:hypothetical protein